MAQGEEIELLFVEEQDTTVLNITTHTTDHTHVRRLGPSCTEAPILFCYLISAFFFVLFIPFYVCQSLLTSMLGGEKSFYCLAILYFTFSCGSLVNCSPFLFAFIFIICIGV